MSGSGSTKVVSRLPASIGNTFDARIAEALAAPHGDLTTISDVQVALGPEPSAGWLDIVVASDGAVRADWSLSNALDPFGIEWEDGSSGARFTFLSWLEDVAVGRASILALDMEGPFGLLAALEDEAPDFVRLLVHTSPGGVSLYGRIARHHLLDAFYRPMITCWESEAFELHWAEWGRPGVAKWDLRSPAIEAKLSD
jgi:hypothetical protein